MDDKEKETASDSTISIGKIFLFGTVLVMFCLVGMFMFARPQVSLLEKRKLAEFPEITFVGVWNARK